MRVTTLSKWIFVIATLLSVPVFAEQDSEADRAVGALDRGHLNQALQDLQNRADHNYGGHEQNAVQFLQKAIEARDSGDLNAVNRFIALAAEQMNMAAAYQPGQIDRAAHPFEPPPPFHPPGEFGYPPPGWVPPPPPGEQLIFVGP